ncbi:uncharacterized protein [Sinocyclocheilus grahami]|uniref:uncharacterized protein n=1 Tax=Sinocyclocheilus grahami TaxID=75366 RepID=UPI0007AD6A1D|nr:PREDICTED: uncharacterized protein LOC107575082 [Sinocyclocheilus grahami]
MLLLPAGVVATATKFNTCIEENCGKRKVLQAIKLYNEQVPDEEERSITEEKVVSGLSVGGGDSGPDSLIWPWEVHSSGGSCPRPRKSSSYLNTRKARHLVPTWQDVEVLEAVNNSLSPLAEFTDALSGEQYVSVSYVKPVLHLFNNKILAEKEGETERSKCIKKKILDYLNEKYDDPQTQELLDMASAIDPRFKLKYVNKDRVEGVKIRLRTEMASITSVMKLQPSVTVTVREEAEDQNAPPYPIRRRTHTGKGC